MKTLTTILLFLGLSITLLAQAQSPPNFEIDFNLSPTINPNPIYWLDEDWDLYFCINNLTTNTLNAIITAELKYKDKVIIKVISNKYFAFQPDVLNCEVDNIFNYNSDDFSIVEAYLPPDEVVDNFKATGELLPGNYEICITVGNTQDCSFLNVMQYERPKLRSPANGEEFEAGASFVTFEWESEFQYPGNQEYIVNFYELLEGQSPDQAIRTNLPVFSEEVEEQTSVFINLDDLQLQAGQQYVWQVKAVDPENNFPIGLPDGLSKPHYFSISTLEDGASNEGSLWKFAAVDQSGNVLPCDEQGGSDGNNQRTVRTDPKATSDVLKTYNKIRSTHSLIENGILRRVNPRSCLQRKEGKFSFTFKYVLTLPCEELNETNSRKGQDSGDPYRVVSRLFKNEIPLGHKTVMVHGKETKDGLDEGFDKERIIKTTDFEYMCIEVGPGEFEQVCAVLINLELEIRDTSTIIETDSFHLVTFIPEANGHKDMNMSLKSFMFLAKSDEHMAKHTTITPLPIQDSKFCAYPAAQLEEKEALRSEKTVLTTHSLDLIPESNTPDDSTSNCMVVPFESKAGNRMVVLTYDLIIEDSTINALDSFTMVSYFSDKRKSPNSLAAYRKMAEQGENPIQILPLPISNSHFCQARNENQTCYEAKNGLVKIPISCFVFLTDEQLANGEMPKLITHVFKNEKLKGKKIQIVDLARAKEGDLKTASASKNGFYYCEMLNNIGTSLPMNVQFVF